MNNRSRAIFWVLAVFLIGALAGGGLVYLLMAPDATIGDASTRPPREGRDGRERDNRDRMMNDLSKLLSLSEAQKTQMRQIFEDSRHDYHEAFAAVRTKTHRKIEQVLAPEQMKKFDEFMRERERERERGRPDRPPGGQRKQQPQP